MNEKNEDVAHPAMVIKASQHAEIQTDFLIRHPHLDNRLLDPVGIIGTTTGPVRKRERVGGLLNYYYREAA